MQGINEIETLEQFKEVYQKILDSGENPRTVQLHPRIAKKLLELYNQLWHSDHIPHLYGLRVIVRKDFRRNKVIFN